MTVFLFIEAVDRFDDPHPINSMSMLVTASLGILLSDPSKGYTEYTTFTSGRRPSSPALSCHLMAVMFH